MDKTEDVSEMPSEVDEGEWSGPLVLPAEVVDSDEVVVKNGIGVLDREVEACDETDAGVDVLPGDPCWSWIT